MKNSPGINKSKPLRVRVKRGSYPAGSAFPAGLICNYEIEKRRGIVYLESVFLPGSSQITFCSEV